jgi:ABC-2 type transport system permease protein
MREIRFLLALWKANFLSAMEYRAAFLTQIVGMMLNNLVYLIFWMIFFDRFKSINGWVLGDIFILYGVAASSIGLGTFLFGNATRLSDIISKGRLDYYLSLPRPVLLHVVASRSSNSGIGDFTFGILIYLFSGQFTLDGLGRFMLGTLLALVVFISFTIIVQSLAFWLGSASGLGNIVQMAIITFAIYPLSLFDTPAKLLLFTLVPAALIGTIPAEFVHGFDWGTLGILFLAAAAFLILAVWVFQRGLTRYESGSGIQTDV